MHLTARSLTRRTILATSILALTATAAFAQTWTGGGDGVSWNQPANWSSLPVSGPGLNIVFNNAAAIVTNQNLGNPFVLGFFQALGAGGLTVNGNALNFNNGASDAVIVSISPALTIGAPVLMTSNTQFNNASAGSLTVSGGLSGAGQVRITQGTTTLTGAGSWTGGTDIGFGSGQGTLRIGATNALSGNVGIGGSAVLEFATAAAGTYANVINGNGVIRQAGPGTTTLTGNNSTWNGSVDVAGGTLIAGSANALGATFSNATTQSGATLEMGVNNALSPVANNFANNGTLNVAGFQQTAAVNLTNAGTISLPGASLLTVGGSNTWTGGSTGSGSLTFAGSTTFNTGTNLQHTGGTTFAGGFNQVNVSNVLPDTGLLQINGGFFSHNATDTVDAVVMTGGNFGATNLTISNTLDMQAGSFSGNVTVNGAFTKTTAGSAVLNGGSFTLSGGGTAGAGTLSIVSTAVNGAFTISGGTVNLDVGSVLSGPTVNNAVLNVTTGTLAGTAVNGGTLNVTNSGSVTAAVTNTGVIDFNNGGGIISGNIAGPGSLSATVGTSATLTGVNSYTGGSTLTGAIVTGHTDSIQGAWSLNAFSVLRFDQNFNGTMAGNISGAGYVWLQGTGFITLSGNNSFTDGVYINDVAGVTHFGVGSNTAAGVGGPIFGGEFKMSAEGGARTLTNPFGFGDESTEFTGTNNLTLNHAGAKTVSGAAVILHTSTGTTTVGGTFLGQNTTTIDVNAGTLVLGAAVNNGFRMDGAINVASGATFQMISNSPVKLGPTNLNGGTLIAPSGVAVPTGLALTANGIIQGRVSSEAGSLIEATGALTMGDANNFGGFFSNGELRTQQFTVNLLDKNQAVLGSLTEVGGASPGNLTAANGVFVDFGRAITGWGTVAGTNALPQASIINGDAEGQSNTNQLDFTGYVKGIGTFTDVTFSGTFSPGLSPAIVPVNDAGFGAASTLLIEIGGLTPGSQHDQLDIGGVLGLNGLLDVDLINGFNPSLGDFFNILDGTASGAFNAFSFPALAPGLAWDTSDLYTVGNLKIVPEPSITLLLLAGLAATLRRRR